MSTRLQSTRRPALALLLSLLLLAGVSALAVPAPAQADSAPVNPADPATPPTVTADALPTVQINGVAWSQAVVGNTVYVAGQFTRARPAGAAAGTQETVRNNLLAYDVRTGALSTTFAPSLNAQALVVTASPDGSRIYVGGDFTQANGQPRARIAAYSTATGGLLNDFRPAIGAQVRAIAAAGSTVYVGGANFGVAGGAPRSYLAAFAAGTGAVLPWAPAATYTVNALAVVNGGTAVVIGGRFATLNGVAARGLGSVEASTGRTRAFAAGTVVNNTGTTAAITSLHADADTVYASGYTLGAGTLEGVVAADPATGAVRWIEDCRGDTHSVWSSGTVAYTAGHAHVCSNSGGFPETDPRSNHRAIAFSKAATGRVGTETAVFAGRPSPTLLNWFPTLALGTFTGQNQGPWDVSGNAQYVVYGGEFPRVNGVAQQGLVRFAVPSLAPNRVAPNSNSGLTPAAASWTSGSVRVSWQSTFDLDNQDLTYQVFRSDQTAPVHEITAASTFWNRPSLGFLDSTAPPGAQLTYRVRARDPFGNAVSGAATAVTVSSDTGSGPDGYSRTVLADAPGHYWRLGESGGSASYDQAGYDDLTLGAGVRLGTAGALTGARNTAATFSGTPTGLASTRRAETGPQTFSVEAWFATTTTLGGKIVGFGSSATGDSLQFDRHVYLDDAGRVSFGVYPGFGAVLTSTRAYNDGRWHHMVASLGSNGMRLYLDGQLVGQRADVVSAERFAGFWRVGGDNRWAGSSNYVAGRIDEVAVYPTVLAAAVVARHHAAGTTTPPANQLPTATFTATVSGLTGAFDGSASTDPEGPLTSYAWNFGDATTGTGVRASHSYAAAGTYTVRLTVTDAAGATATTTRSVTVVAPAPPPPPGGPIAADAFGREIVGGFGAADIGGMWTVTGDTAGTAVSGGSGTLITGAGRRTSALLAGSVLDVAVQADVALQQATTGSGTAVHLATRNVGTTRYQAKLWCSPSGAVQLSVGSVVASLESTRAALTLPGSHPPGTVFTVRFETSGTGPTVLRAKAWVAGTAEPVDWQVIATDVAAELQRPGGLLAQTYVSASATGPQTVRLDNFWAGSAGAASAAP